MKINQRLFDHYGIDTRKDLRIKARCPRPYDTLLIDKQGSCYACECTAWLPQSIGNLKISSLAEILESPMRDHLQSSISDGTYRYCNEKQCSYIKLGEYGFKWMTQRGLQLRLAIDDSCNLRCPSCRKGMIFHKDGAQFRLGIRLADRINEWLSTCDVPVQVHLGSDGDPFASHVYGHFMRHTPIKNNVRYSMLTNGLMFKEFHKSIPHVLMNLDDLGVSVDGASAETYERLRLGGRWDKINENLHSIAEVKRERGFNLSIHMVVQQENYHEIDGIIDLARKHGADQVYLNAIQDWNTGLDFGRQKFSESDELRKTLKRVSEDHHPLTGIPPVVRNNVISV